MRRLRGWFCVLLLGIGSCGVIPPPNSSDILTELAFTNFSKDLYAMLGVREHRAVGGTGFAYTPLIPPGAIFRVDFFEFVGAACPETLDVQLLLYRRVHADLPIGLDEGEVVESVPVSAAELRNVPACNTAVVGFYTIVTRDTPAGIGRVKIGQGTDIETAIRNSARPEFNADGVWEFTGVAPDLADRSPTSLLASESIRGRVLLANGEGIEGIGVLLRTRFRIRDNDDDPNNDPDAGFSDPIAFTTTDPTGRFTIARPPGSYEITFFSDNFLFRPATLVLETPIENITVVADPL